MDGMTIEDFRTNALHAVMYGLAADDTLEVLIRESPEEIARVGDDAEVRMGVAEHGDIPVGVVLFKFGGPVYRTYWNLRAEGSDDLFAALSNSIEHVHISMIGDNASQDLMFRIGNTLGNFFAAMRERYATHKSWDEADFMEAIGQMDDQISPGDAWRLLGPVQ